MEYDYESNRYKSGGSQLGTKPRREARVRVDNYQTDTKGRHIRSVGHAERRPTELSQDSIYTFGAVQSQSAKQLEKRTLELVIPLS